MQTSISQIRSSRFLAPLALACAVLTGCSSTAPRPDQAHAEWTLTKTQTVPSNAPAASQARLVLYRAAAPGEATPINIYVNGEYQASLLGGAYTNVDVCAGPVRLVASVSDANRAYADKAQAGVAVALLDGSTRYFSVQPSPGGASLTPVDASVARQALGQLPRQSHTLSRVDAPKCAPASQVVAAAPAPVLAAPQAQPVTPPLPTRYTLQAKALFQFDRSTAQHLLPDGLRQIQDIARQINQDKAKVASIVVIGHTDPTGAQAYNQRLSQARAQTVAQELVRAGLASERISNEGRGARDLVVTDCSSGTKAQKNQCNQPNRRVEIIVSANKP